MRMIDGIIAIVGRPNVGKSTIFNRFIQERLSIVEDTPGITRDRIYGKATWLTKELRIIDTGGIQLLDQPFQEEIKAQVDIAIEESDVIVFVVNGNDGVTNDDMYIAKLLQKANKPVVLAVNKIDDSNKKLNIYEFYNLGLSDPIAVSGIHGIGIGDVLDECIKYLPNKSINEYEDSIKFAIIGQPNVGKSSLVNAILNEDRVIVSNIEGTTRDAIDTPFSKDGKDYVVIDTAGIRKKGKVYENVEKYSVLRAMSAIERADVILFVIDGEKGIREQDKHVAGYAYEAGKGIIIVYNKWDTVEKDSNTLKRYEAALKERLAPFNDIPVIFTSVIKKQRIMDVLDAVARVYANYSKKISTSVLNEEMLPEIENYPPPAWKGKYVKIKYVTQLPTKSPAFAFFCNLPQYVKEPYKRFLENRLREKFDFTGCPVRIFIRQK